VIKQIDEVSSPRQPRRDHQENIMDSIRIIATFVAIALENRDRFKATAVELTRLAASEQGTLEYSYYLTPDEKQCLLIETYASAEALAAHMGHVGHLLGSLFESGGRVEVSILGDAPEALIDATKDFEPTMYSLLVSS
jgi:hypothetical protein